MLSEVNGYNPAHFIPPFNALTQAAVDVLVENGVKFIYTFDVAMKSRLASAIAHPDIGGNFGGYVEDYIVPPDVVFVVSEWQKTYASVGVVRDYVSRNLYHSQITLHWIFDARDLWNYTEEVTQLALIVQEAQV